MTDVESGSLAEQELLTAVERGLKSVGRHDTEGLAAVKTEFHKFFSHPMVCTADPQMKTIPPVQARPAPHIYNRTQILVSELRVQNKSKWRRWEAETQVPAKNQYGLAPTRHPYVSGELPVRQTESRYQRRTWEAPKPLGNQVAMSQGDQVSSPG